MDTLVRQNKRKEKAKGADSRKRMHRERQRSVSSRHRSRIDFLSLYLGTIDNRFWPRLLFVNFLLSSTVRISILGWVIYIWIRTIYSMYRWFMVERIVITVQGILPRLLLKGCFIKCNSLYIFNSFFSLNPNDHFVSS